MIDFSTKNEGTWFPYDRSNPDLGSICLREMPQSELKKIKKITTQTKRKFKRGQYTEIVETNEELEMKLIFNYCIVDWKNTYLDGQAIECNMTNKERMLESVDFVKLMTEFLEELNESNNALKEAREKNSEIGSIGN